MHEKLHDRLQLTLPQSGSILKWIPGSVFSRKSLTLTNEHREVPLPRGVFGESYKFTPQVCFSRQTIRRAFKGYSALAHDNCLKLQTQNNKNTVSLSRGQTESLLYSILSSALWFVDALQSYTAAEQMYYRNAALWREGQWQETLTFPQPHSQLTAVIVNWKPKEV